jgi:hypothetical protein
MRRNALNLDLACVAPGCCGDVVSVGGWDSFAFNAPNDDDDDDDDDDSGRDGDGDDEQRVGVG